MNESPNPDFVLSLSRGLQVIEAFQGERQSLSVSDLAERTGLSRAAVRRLLITLELLGYAERSRVGFALTTRILRLGFSFVTSNSLTSKAVPILDKLSASIHESCSVSVLEGEQIVYVARSAAKRVMAVDLGIGSRLPAYCTSMGRVLLAALDADGVNRYLTGTKLNALTPRTLINAEQLRAVLDCVRREGYAIVDEELELGLRSIAVPVASPSGRVVAAMNSGVSASRMTVEQMRSTLLPPLREHARQLGDLLA